MSKHTELLKELRDLMTDPTTLTFGVGWLLAGSSEIELERLRDAMKDFSRESSLMTMDLLLERFGQPPSRY